MGIGSINPYGSLHTSYPPRDIPKVDPEEAGKQRIQTEEQDSRADTLQGSYRPPAENLRSKSADLENISLSFQRKDTFSMEGEEGLTTGKDSSLLTLDMQKAISDMKKDSILEDYQYFVGSSQELKAVTEGTDGTVIQKF